MIPRDSRTSPARHYPVWLPPTLMTRALLLRGLVIWLGMKLVVTSGGVAVGQALIATGAVAPPPPSAGPAWMRALQLAPSAALLLIAIVGWLTLVDVRRRNELLFLANLGVGPSSIVGLGALPAVVFELWIRVL